MPLVKIRDSEGTSLMVRNLGEYYQSAAFQGIDSVVENLPGFTARPDDVWIMGYAKTGCHWTHQIAASLMYNLPTVHDRSKFTSMLEMTPMETITNASSPRVINSHFLPSYVPQVIKSGCKIIYTVRNPKDVVISAHHHLRTVKAYDYSGTINGVQSLILEGKFGGAPFFHHLNEWWTVLEDKPNALVVFYEELKQDPLAGIQSISEFLGKQYDDTFYQQVANSTDFSAMAEAMRPKEPKHMFVEGGTLLRKGIVGDWKGSYTEEMNKQMDQVFEKELNDFPALKRRIVFEI